MRKCLAVILCVLYAAGLSAVMKSRDAGYFIDIIAQNRALPYNEVGVVKDPKILRLMRNAVYARNGYVFSDKSLRDYFAKYKWYTPRFRGVDDRLSSNDKSNLEMIISVENGLRFDSLLKKSFTGYNPVSSAVDKSLIGIWQNAPIMASGWSDTYAFYPDRKVVKRGNQMDCAKRELWKMGNWRLEKGTLVIEYFAVGRIEGGKFVEATGSCGSDTELIEGTHIIGEIDPIQKEEITVSAIEVRKDADIERKSMMIGAMRFWLMRSDPKEY